MSEELECSTCKFYVPTDTRTKGSGYCHRFPPPYHPIQTEDGEFCHHPKVEPYDWCGEWRMVDPK